VRDQWTMVIAVVAVAVVQLASAEVINMVAVRNLLMPLGLVVTITGYGRASRRVYIADRDGVFIIVIAVKRVQMTVVQVISMTFMSDGQMAALLAMDMCMVSVSRMLHNSFLSEQTS
jgi:hypothetical protein